MSQQVPGTTRDEFLSEEDLDLSTLDDAELMAWWDLWFRQAQDTNDTDEWVISHGVFNEVPPSARPLSPAGPQDL